MFDYSLNGLHLDRVDKIIDLGFLFVPSLDFRPHIDHIVGKAVRILGFIRRHSASLNSPMSLSALLCSNTLGTSVWFYCLVSVYRW